MTDALEKEHVPSPTGSPRREDDELSVSPLTVRNRIESDEASDYDSRNYSKPAHRPSLPWPHARHVSLSSESVASGQSEGSNYGTLISPLTVSPFTPVSKRSTTSSVMAQNSMSNLRMEHSSIDGRASLKQEDREIRSDSSENTESTHRDSGHTEVLEAVASAMQQLHQVLLREQSLRPLRVEPQDKFHRPDPELIKKFESLAYDELKVRRLSSRDWLLVAVWWLLKVCIMILLVRSC